MDHVAQGAGLYAALVLQGEADRTWQDWYFDWLYENADPQTASGAKARSGRRSGPFSTIWRSFHYLFNHEYAHMPLRYPDRVIDSCLGIFNEVKVKTFDGSKADYNNRWEQVGKSVSFAESTGCTA